LLVLAISVGELYFPVVNLLAFFFERTLSFVTAFLEGGRAGGLSWLDLHHAVYGGLAHFELLALSVVHLFGYCHHLWGRLTLSIDNAHFRTTTLEHRHMDGRLMLDVVVFEGSVFLEHLTRVFVLMKYYTFYGDSLTVIDLCLDGLDGVS